MKLKQKPKQTQKKKMVDFEALEGEEETTFVELMALEELELESGLVGGGGRGERRFMSWRSAYNPGSGQAYGGVCMCVFFLVGVWFGEVSRRGE